MLINSKDLLNLARDKKFAVPSTNFIDQNSIKAYVNVAEKLNLPIILAYAEAHDDYISLSEAAMLGKYYGKKAKVPVVLHFDHGTDINKIKKAVDLGFTSVMIDASQEPFEENVRRTLEIVDYAHKFGVTVEAEIGHVGSGENYENHEISESQLTTPEDAKRFVEETDVDSLAVSIGTAHGTYKQKPKLNFKRLEEIFEVVDIPLVLHGGSSTGDEKLNRCAKNGITKINIFTDLINAGYDGIKESEPKTYLDVIKSSQEGMAKCLEHYYKVFETENF